MGVGPGMQLGVRISIPYPDFSLHGDSQRPLSADALALVPEVPNTPRASPGTMARFWREERLLEGSLSPSRAPISRPGSPRGKSTPCMRRPVGSPVTTSPRRKGSPLGTGSPTDAGDFAGSQHLEKSVGARLSIAHAEAHKHAEVSRRRGQEIQQMQAGLEALLLQIDVLREAHEGVTASHTKLEGKLRLEEGRARKLSRQLNTQREGVVKAAAREAEARGEAETLRNKLDEYRASLQLEEQQGREDRDKYNRLAVELRRVTKLLEQQQGDSSSGSGPEQGPPTPSPAKSKGSRVVTVDPIKLERQATICHLPCAMCILCKRSAEPPPLEPPAHATHASYACLLSAPATCLLPTPPSCRPTRRLRRR